MEGLGRRGNGYVFVVLLVLYNTCPYTFNHAALTLGLGPMGRVGLNMFFSGSPAVLVLTQHDRVVPPDWFCVLCDDHETGYLKTQVKKRSG